MRKHLLLGMLIAATACPAGAAEDNADLRAMREQLRVMQQKLKGLDALKRRVKHLQDQLNASKQNTQLAGASSGKTPPQNANQTESSSSSATSDDSAAQTSVVSNDTSGETAGSAPENRQNRQSGQTQVAGVDIGTTTGQSRPKRQLTREKVKKIASEVYSEQQSNSVDFGGSARYNYTYADYNDNQQERGGDLNFAVFVLQASADIENVLFQLDYRFYDYQRALHNAWVGYRFPDKSQVEIGVMQQPFGLLPFASNNYFFSSNFYLGLEDDYDAGIKYSGSHGPVDYAVAFYKNDEKGGGGGDQRYSVDATNLPMNNGLDENGAPYTDSDSEGYGDLIQETNTGVARVAYVFGRDSDYSTEVGLSGRYGQIYNKTQDSHYGTNWAGAVHLDGQWDRWELMLEASRYEYHLDGNETAIGAAAYAFNYPFASEGTTYIANLSYTLPLDYGPFDSLKLYQDFSYVGDKSGGFTNTRQEVFGALLSAGNIYTYFDLINGKNEPFDNGFMTGSQGSTQTLFNLNIGYYF